MEGPGNSIISEVTGDDPFFLFLLLSSPTRSERCHGVVRQIDLI